MKDTLINLLKYYKDFEKSTRCLIVEKAFKEGDIKKKKKDQDHIKLEYWQSRH